MLTLKIYNNRELLNIVEPMYSRFDWSIDSTRSVPTVGYIDGKYLNSAFIPLPINEIGIDLYTTTVISTADENITALNEKLAELYNALSQSKFGLYKIYTNDVDIVTSSLDTDLYSTPNDAVQSLYNKCVEQTALRNEWHAIDANIKVKLMRGKHAIVIVTNINDNDQASDIFLTLGLIPILFPDWKDKFNEQEIEYFKVLVNRSQVKRIANVKATEAFKNMLNTSKYTELALSIRTAAAIDKIVETRIDNAQQALNRSSETCESLLRRYNDERIRYYRALKVLDNIKETKEDVRNEIRLATSLEGVVKVEAQDTYIITGFKAPYTFYDSDEVECAIKNWPEESLAYKVINDVFVLQKYKMMVYNEFTFSYNPDASLHTPGGLNVDTYYEHGGFINPHTYFYNCLGDYKPQLIDAQSKGDLLMFNNIALASTKSINFRDGAVINRLRDFINGFDVHSYTDNRFINTQCLVDEEGNPHSIFELYLKQEPQVIEVQDL